MAASDEARQAAVAGQSQRPEKSDGRKQPPPAHSRPLSASAGNRRRTWSGMGTVHTGRAALSPG